MWRYKYHTQFSSCEADGRDIVYYEIVSRYNDLVHDAKVEQFTPIRSRSDIPSQKIESCYDLFASDATHEAVRNKRFYQLLGARCHSCADRSCVAVVTQSV